MKLKEIWACTDCYTVMKPNNPPRYDPHADKCEFESNPHRFISAHDYNNLSYSHDELITALGKILTLAEPEEDFHQVELCMSTIRRISKQAIEKAELTAGEEKE